MPTGYTAIIEDKPDVTFREYATLCARAFGCCIMQRDESLASPPRPRERSDYHDKYVAAARAKLVELRAMTPESARPIFDAEVRKARESNAEFRAEHERKQAAYSKMRAQVVAWMPPTSEHDGIKRFMLEQIDLCYRPDEQPYQAPEPTDVATWLAEQIASEEWDIEYHTKKANEETERVESGNTWLATHLASLPA